MFVTICRRWGDGFGEMACHGFELGLGGAGWKRSEMRENVWTENYIGIGHE